MPLHSIRFHPIVKHNSIDLSSDYHAEANLKEEQKSQNFTPHPKYWLIEPGSPPLKMLGPRNKRVPQKIPTWFGLQRSAHLRTVSPHILQLAKICTSQDPYRSDSKICRISAAVDPADRSKGFLQRNAAKSIHHSDPVQLLTFAQCNWEHFFGSKGSTRVRWLIIQRAVTFWTSATVFRTKRVGIIIHPDVVVKRTTIIRHPENRSFRVPAGFRTQTFARPSSERARDPALTVVYQTNIGSLSNLIDNHGRSLITSPLEQQQLAVCQP